MADFPTEQKAVTRAFLVGVQAPGMSPGEGAELLGELNELVETLNLTITHSTLPIQAPVMYGFGKVLGLYIIAGGHKL